MQESQSFVARPYSIEGIDFPDNVVVHTNLPSDQTWRLVADSQGMVIPLQSDNTACGHITIVGTQLLGVPLAVTQSSGVEDYVDSSIARMMLAGSRDDMAAAIAWLNTEQGAAAKMAQSANDLVAARSSLDRWVEYFQTKVTNI